MFKELLSKVKILIAKSVFSGNTKKYLEYNKSLNDKLKK